MKKNFVYFYFMKTEPEKIQKTVPSHIEYWKQCQLESYSGGPFEDRSGGLICFAAASFEEANSIVMKDPFVTEDILDKKWLKVWLTEK